MKNMLDQPKNIITIFDFVLETRCNNFINWLQSEIPFQEKPKVNQWRENKNAKEGDVIINGEYYPPFYHYETIFYFSLQFYVIEKIYEDDDQKYIWDDTKNETGLNQYHYDAEIEVREITNSTIQAICRTEDNRFLVNYLKQLESRVILVFSPEIFNDIETKEIPEKPEIPKKPTESAINGNIDHWFEWREESREAGIKITLKDIADWTGYAPGTVKNKHRLYKISKGK